MGKVEWFCVSAPRDCKTIENWQVKKKMNKNSMANNRETMWIFICTKDIPCTGNQGFIASKKNRKTMCVLATQSKSLLVLTFSVALGEGGAWGWPTAGSLLIYGKRSRLRNRLLLYLRGFQLVHPHRKEKPESVYVEVNFFAS